jgi:hypothetical protein
MRKGPQRPPTNAGIATRSVIGKVATPRLTPIATARVSIRNMRRIAEFESLASTGRILTASQRLAFRE